MVHVCPGVTNYDEVQTLRDVKPEGMPGGITMGNFCDWTRDIDDPGLERTPSDKRRGLRERYVTICRRLVAEARERGLLNE